MVIRDLRDNDAITCLRVDMDMTIDAAGSIGEDRGQVVIETQIEGWGDARAAVVSLGDSEVDALINELKRLRGL